MQLQTTIRLDKQHEHAVDKKQKQIIPRSLLSRYSAASNNLWILISCTAVILLRLTIRVGMILLATEAELFLNGRQVDDYIVPK